MATARLEYYDKPASLPNVEWSSLKLDLYRRDFTMNTPAVRLDDARFGELVDFFGGEKDIKDKVVRIIQNLSFIEDPTRIYRALRFSERFDFSGNLSVGIATPCGDPPDLAHSRHPGAPGQPAPVWNGIDSAAWRAFRTWLAGRLRG